MPVHFDERFCFVCGCFFFLDLVYIIKKHLKKNYAAAKYNQGHKRYTGVVFKKGHTAKCNMNLLKTLVLAFPKHQHKCTCVQPLQKEMH